jgi:hypothetical protein
MKKILTVVVVLSGLYLTSAQEQKANVRVAHLSPDAPVVDVWVNGAKTLEGVSFKAVSGYSSLVAGETTVWVVPAGKTEPKVIDAKLKLEAGKSYTVAATGFLKDLKPTVFEDNFKPVASQALVRFLHTSPDAPAVDVGIAGYPRTIFSATAFPKATEYVPAPPGSYDFEVKLAGTQNLVLTVKDVKLEASKVYSVFAVGSVADKSLGAVLVVDNK